MEYTTQNLEYAVSVFYNGEQSERAKAHAWLTTAQRVPQAWQFVWELLEPNKGTEIQFYGATTLHTKILRCWYELPPESYEELKNKILMTVLTYAKGPKIVTNRLCISLAALILQQGSKDLVSILRPLSTAENKSLLLEVLTVIPEEYNSMTMGSSLRTANRAALQEACPAVLDDMLRYLQSVYTEYAGPPPKEEVLAWTLAANCAQSWLCVGGEDAAGGSPPLHERLPLCAALCRCVSLLAEAAAECGVALEACEAALACTRAAATAGDAHRAPKAALQLCRALLQLAALPALQPPQAHEELVAALVSCCVAVGECHASSLVREAEREGGEGARQLVELLLAAQGARGFYPLHETRSSLVFGFWYTLQDEILNIVDSTNKMHPIWREVFTRLLTSLIAKSELPSEDSLSKDDIELLRCYRQDIADTVMYCVGILGNYCWTVVEEAFAGSSKASEREAALHVLLALSDAAPSHSVPACLVRMMEHVVDIVARQEDCRILTTALDCLGAYGAWMSELGPEQARSLCGRGAQAAGAALGAGGGAGSSGAQAAAARALRRLCADAAAAVAPLAPHILAAAMSAEGRSSPWMRRQLLAAAGAALAANDVATAAPMLIPLANSLKEDLDAQALAPTKPTGIAESIAALLNALGPKPELAATVVTIILPSLPAYTHHTDLVEPMFLILKQAVWTLMEGCLPLANEIAALTATGFEIQPSALGLDVVKNLSLGLSPAWAPGGELLRACVCSCWRAMEAAPERGARSELADALFQLLRAVTKKRPALLAHVQELLPALLEWGAGAVGAWRGAEARAASEWAAALAGAAPATLRPHAPTLAKAAAGAIGGAALAGASMGTLAALLLALNRAHWPAEEGAEGEGRAQPKEDLSAWLRTALAPPDFPSRHATPDHKARFLQAVAREKSSKRRLLESVQEFSLVCRGLVGTEYARQALASKQLVA